MKNILILFLAAFAVSSCLETGSFSQTYVANVTFEYNSQEVYTNSFKDSLFVMNENGQFSDNKNPLTFSQVSEKGDFKGGFLLSYLNGEKDGALTKAPAANDAYRVYAASGHNGSKTYAVFYDSPNSSNMPKHDIEFLYKNPSSMVPQVCYVNNTTLVARKIKEYFQSGDKLVLKAIGVASNGSTVETSIKLADYTESRDSVMYNWTEFPLSSLGAVESIDFKVESTNPNVPGYFCLDGLVAGISINM